MGSKKNKSIMSNDLFKKEKKFIINTYSRYPIILTRGDGVYLYDNKNKKYLDFLSGISVNNLGYNNSEIIKIINESVKKLIHTSNLFYTEPQIKLAEKLSKLTNKGQVFFCNSGAEANEAAIKLTRAYGNYFKIPKHNIITLKNSFHGRTLATVFATGQEKYQKGFEPRIETFIYAEPNNIENIKKLINEKTAGIMIEFVQGEGGVNVLDKNFVKYIYKICQEKEIIFIADEVQTGLGRTSKLFAFQHYGVIPDIITLAKSLAAGLPMGAMIAKRKYSKYFKPGMHASTFGGGFLVSNVANYVVDKVSNKNFLKNIQRVGNYFYKKLIELKNEFSFIEEVKGLGLMLGLKLSIEANKIVLKAIENGLIINSVQNYILRFLPPLIITEKEIDEAIEILRKIFKEIQNEI